MDMVDVLSVVIILFSLGVFYWFGRFTQNLIKQHYDIYGLLYDVEEMEKEKNADPFLRYIHKSRRVMAVET